jgi:hypothetical protein
MALTLESVDRRVTALEQGAEREQSLERAVAEIVSESERRVQSEIAGLRHEMSTLRTELRVEIKVETQRLTEEISAAKRDMIDLLNDRFDQVMTAFDRPKNSPA